LETDRAASKAAGAKSRFPGESKEDTMSDVSQFAYQLAPAQLRLPQSEQFAVDGLRIGRKTQSMSAILPRIDPAVILSITRAPEYLQSSASTAAAKDR